MQYVQKSCDLKMVHSAAEVVALYHVIICLHCCFDIGSSSQAERLP